MKSLIAHNSGEQLTIIPPGMDDSDLYMQRLMFLEYMSDSTNDRTAPGLREFAGILELPYAILRKWKGSVSFQTLLAKRTRDKALGGLGLALAYEELMKIVADVTVPTKTRAKAATDIAKLSMKQEELYLRYKLSKDKHREVSNRKTYEQEVAEAEYEVLSEGSVE